MDWRDGELLGFDLETTGPDPLHARPVSFALSTFVAEHVALRDASIVDPGIPIPAGATAIHGVTTERAQSEGRELGETVTHLLHRLVAASERGVPVVGMNIAYDLTIVERLGEQLTGAGLRARGWCGPALDVLVLDRHLDPYRKGRRRLGELCAVFGVALASAHEAAADAEAAVEVLLALCELDASLGATGLDELYANQAIWHEEWARSYDDWRASNSLDRLPANQFSWPFGC